MAERHGCRHKALCYSNSVVCCACDPAHTSRSEYCRSCRVIMIEESQASPVSPRGEERSSPDAGPSLLELVAIEVYGQDQSWADDTESELLSRQPDASPVPPESFEIGVYDTGQSWADQVHDELLSRQAATMPSASSNWMRRPASPTASPLLINLKKLAEDASVLLELLCQTMPVQEDDIAEEHTQMAAGAAASILEIETGIRRIVARRNGDVGSQRGLDTGDTRIDAACIICYSEIADTVFIPCRHLALCGVCCNEIGIHERNIGPVVVRCPVCRTGIRETVKIFRA